MNIDFRTLEPRERYKLIVGAVVPRPIALVTSVNLDGRVNAAPFSFFNAMCNDPPALAVGVNRSSPRREKDTSANIDDTGQFVVNLVDEAMAEGMNICEVEFPPDVSELEAAGFTAAPSVQVRAPWIREAPIAFECRLLVNLQLAAGKNIIIGEAIHMHIRDDLFDAEKNYILAEKARLIGRMHGAGWYARTSDLFDLPRLTPDEKRTRYGVDGIERPPMGRDRR